MRQLTLSRRVGAFLTGSVLLCVLIWLSATRGNEPSQREESRSTLHQLSVLAFLSSDEPTASLHAKRDLRSGGAAAMPQSTVWIDAAQRVAARGEGFHVSLVASAPLATGLVRRGPPFFIA